MFVFIYLVNAEGILVGEKINFEVANSIGSFIGGLVGSFWTLTGVLLYFSVIRAQKNESEQAATRHEEQIDLLNFQKFQASFYELFKLFLAKRDLLNNCGRRNEDNSKNIFAFDEMTQELNQYAGDYNSEWDKGRRFSSEDIFLLHDSYSEKMIEFCEFFMLILTEINRYPDKSKGRIYERILFNVLTFKQIASIIHCAVQDFDKSSRLKNSLFQSEYWETRCLIMLTQENEINNFWTRYRSIYRDEYP